MVKRSRPQKKSKAEEHITDEYSDSGCEDSDVTDPSYHPADGNMSDTLHGGFAVTGPSTPANSRGRKKKLGRPATFEEEDIDWDKLTPEERRKIRRRLSNRRSAHRVRQRRLEMMDTLQSKVEMLHKQQAVMIARLQEGDSKQEQLRNELVVARERWAATAQENMRLVAENATLRRLLEDAKIPIPTASSLDLSQVVVLQPDTLAAHLINHAATAAAANTTIPTNATTTAAAATQCPTPMVLAHTRTADEVSNNTSHPEEGNNEHTPTPGPPTTMLPPPHVLPTGGPQAPLPPPSGFAAAQSPMSLAPPTTATGGTAMMGGPHPLSLPRGMLSDQLLTQFTLDLNRAYTLSLNLSDLDVAPSLGLNTLLDLGGMLGGGNNTLL